MAISTPNVTENNTSGSTSTSLTTLAVGSVVWVFFPLNANSASLSSGPSSTHVTWDGSAAYTQTSDATVARTIVVWRGIVSSVATAAVSYASASVIREVVFFEYSDNSWSNPTWTTVATGGNFIDSEAANTNFNDVAAGAVTTGSTGDQAAIGYIRASNTVNANTPAPFTNVQLTNPPGSGYIHAEGLTVSTGYTPTSQVGTAGTTVCSAVVFFQATAPSGSTALPHIVIPLPPRRRRVLRGFSFFSKGPVNPVPLPQVVVSTPPRSLRKALGRIRILKGVTPAGQAAVAPPPVFVATAADFRRRGRLRLVQGPVNPVAVPPTVVSKPPPRRRGRIRVIKGATLAAPVVVPLPPVFVSKPTLRRRLNGWVEVFVGFTPPPVTGPALPPLVSTPTPRRRGRVQVHSGPVNVVPRPPVLVSTPAKIRRRGVVRLFQGPVPATPATPLAPTFVSKPVARRPGRIRLTQGPVNPVPVPPTVVSKPTPRRRGRLVLLQGPVNPVHIPPTIVSSPAKVRRRGRVFLFHGPANVVTVVPPPPTLVSAPAKVRRRGTVKLVQGPVNPVAAPLTLVSKPAPPRRGRIFLLRGPVPAVAPAAAPLVLVSKPPARRRGRVSLLRGVTPAATTGAAPAPVVSKPTPRRRGRALVLRGPVPPVPVPPVFASKPPRARRGRVFLLRGPVNVVPVPPTVVSKPPPRRRGRIRIFKGVTFVPPFTVGFLGGGTSPQTSQAGSTASQSQLTGTVEPQDIEEGEGA